MKLTFDVPEALFNEMLGHIEIPPLVPVRQRIETPQGLPDVESATREAQHALGAVVFAGERIAIAVGSRGIGHLPEVVRGVVAELKAAGAESFIVPAMGSHGGATAEGQREVLEHLGITEALVGAPVVSDMVTEVVGQLEDGTPVHMDRHALAADGIVMVVRVKPHTAFRGRYESGLAKMIAIGLGKQVGASLTHARGFGEIARMVPDMAGVALRETKIRFGIAVLENAHDQPYRIVAVPAGRIMDEEPELLDEARATMPRIPFPRFDVLVIDRIGKNISGDGADPNITGRYPTPFASGGPQVTRQVVLDLTPESAGNANGAGTADFTTVRLASKMSFAGTYPNALTSTVPRPVALPMVLPNDRLAIAAALQTCNAVGRVPTVVRIVDTLHLEYFWASESLLVATHDEEVVESLAAAGALHFDDAGNLTDLGQVPDIRAGVQ
jgi:hypothetical protein